MVEVYKLLFDLAFYYTLSGYFLRLIWDTPPAVSGFLALALAVGIDTALRTRSLRRKAIQGFITAALPLLSLLFRPTLPQILQLAPAWAYLVWAMLSGRFAVNYSVFRSQYSFALKLLPLLVLGPLFPARFVPALTASVPFLVLMLVCGVCLLRMLREARPEGLRQGVYMAGFVALCAGLTVGRAPQLLLQGAGLLYKNVVAPLIFVLAVVLAALTYGFYLVLKWLVERAQGNREPLQIELSGAAEALGLEEQYAAYTADLSWLKILLLVLGAAALVFGLLLIFRRLLGERTKTGPAQPFIEKRTVLSSPRRGSPAARRFRPRDPRLAIRYDYARFLAECRRRGAEFSRGMTVSELSAAAARFFPGADAAALAALYAPARYALRREITTEEARAAAAAWEVLRRSAPPAGSPAAKKEKKRK